MNDEGKQIHHSKYEGIEYPREEGETPINYLYRLLCLNDKRKQRKMKDMMDSMPKLGGFSLELQKAVVGNLVAGSAITEAMKSNQFFEPDLKEAASSHYNLNNNMMQMQDRLAKAKREPFDKLGKKLDTLIQFTNISTENLVQGNSQQAQMGAEIKSVGDETNKLQKNILQENIEGSNRSNTKTNVIILLTIIGIITPLVLSFCTGSDKSDMKAENIILLEQTKRDVQNLKKSNDLYSQEINRLHAEIEQFKNTNK